MKMLLYHGTNTCSRSGVNGDLCVWVGKRRSGGKCRLTGGAPGGQRFE